MQFSNAQLIRQWWTEYGEVLRAELNGLGQLDKLNALTRKLTSRGVIALGRSMTREGAEALAARCDQLRRLL